MEGGRQTAYLIEVFRFGDEFEKGIVGQTDKRAAQHRQKRHGVPGVDNEAHEVAEVKHLLAMLVA